MIVLLFSLFAFLAIGVPIAFSLGLSTTLYFIIFNKDLLQVVPQMLFAGMDSYTLIALPLFILMGQLMNESKITSRLIDYCLIFIGNIRGGLGIVNVISSMLFGGISGSSVSDTASIGSILIPEMKKTRLPRRIRCWTYSCFFYNGYDNTSQYTNGPLCRDSTGICGKIISRRSVSRNYGRCFPTLNNNCDFK